ncbi:SH3 domain-containing protein [Sphingomonas piscis]|nr:SH3 domain-containing protein [Sphingomonas piscis]
MLRKGALTVVALSLAASAAAQDKPVPYWASLASGEAMMRTGPARTYPGIWLYKRRDLPVRVLKRYESWRLIQDPDGTKGWMLSTMLSDRRSAIVKPGEPRPILSQPSDGAKLRYRAQAGVVGKIEKCSSGWCHIQIGKRDGYIRVADIWGVAPDEVVD